MFLGHKYSDQVSRNTRKDIHSTASLLQKLSQLFVNWVSGSSQEGKWLLRLLLGPTLLNMLHSILKARSEVLKFKPLRSTKWEQPIAFPQSETVLTTRVSHTQIS